MNHTVRNVAQGRRDPALQAVVRRRTPLRYQTPVEGLPAHVRSASSAVLQGPFLWVIQDDVNALARVHLDTMDVEGLLLPADAQGRRTFSEELGTKRLKMDLECAFLAPAQAGSMLVALGSGSTDQRERVVLVEDLHLPVPRVRVVEAHGLYAALRAEPAFSGSELNVEGAVCVGNTVRLFNRGNGAARDGRVPQNAWGEVLWDDLWAHFHSGGAPLLSSVTPCNLGQLDGVPLGFTGAANLGAKMLVVAAAEASPDAYRDGVVTGSVLGVVEESSVRWAPLTFPDGTPWTAKLEGLELDPAHPRTAYVTVDADDPDTPAELALVELLGPW